MQFTVNNGWPNISVQPMCWKVGTGDRALSHYASSLLYTDIRIPLSCGLLSLQEPRILTKYARFQMIIIGAPFIGLQISPPVFNTTFSILSNLSFYINGS